MNKFCAAEEKEHFKNKRWKLMPDMECRLLFKFHNAENILGYMITNWRSRPAEEISTTRICRYFTLNGRGRIRTSWWEIEEEVAKSSIQEARWPRIPSLHGEMETGESEASWVFFSQAHKYVVRCMRFAQNSKGKNRWQNSDKSKTTY